MDDKILFNVKPKFIFQLRYISNIFRALPLAAGMWVLLNTLKVFSLFYKMFDYTQVTIEILHLLDMGVFLCSFLISWCISIAIMTYFDKKNFETASYKIFEDRAVLEEGVINHKIASLNLTDIKEIYIKQNFFQKRENLGTIEFITSADHSILFKDIENPSDIYEKIEQLRSCKL